MLPSACVSQIRLPFAIGKSVSERPLIERLHCIVFCVIVQTWRANGHRAMLGVARCLASEWASNHTPGTIACPHVCLCVCWHVCLSACTLVLQFDFVFYFAPTSVSSQPRANSRNQKTICKCMNCSRERARPRRRRTLAPLLFVSCLNLCTSFPVEELMHLELAHSMVDIQAD